MIDAIKGLLSLLHDACLAVVLPMTFFTILALTLKGRHAFSDFLRALPECRLNLMLHFADALFVLPLITLIAYWLDGYMPSRGSTPISKEWEELGPAISVILALLLGDLIGYWRHRLEHSRALWPSHAVHHSDTAMTWLAIYRFHPINRLTTALIDSTLLLAAGVPAYCVLVNNLVRHYYGAFVHADLPWTYGALRYVFVSPAMHRWHHAAAPEAIGKNFATVFSFIDLIFGTFRVPGACRAPLGVGDAMTPGFVGQMAHPFKRSSYVSDLRDAKAGTSEDLSPARAA